VAPYVKSLNFGLKYMDSLCFVYRQVGPDSAETLAKIHEECFPTYWDQSAFNDFFAVAGTYAMLAEQQGQAAGMIVWRLAGEQADILTLAVRPAFRRQGLARTLLAQALENLGAQGIQTLFLDVEDGNHAAIHLYEQAGFTHQRRRKLYYRQKDGTYTDALVMQRKLG
jgi:ribosomal-protein-alanine N-acetyltransferase